MLKPCYFFCSIAVSEAIHQYVHISTDSKPQKCLAAALDLTIKLGAKLDDPLKSLPDGFLPIL